MMVWGLQTSASSERPPLFASPPGGPSVVDSCPKATALYFDTPDGRSSG
jgi:hypothetical protein